MGRNNPLIQSVPSPKSTRGHTSGTAQEREAETSQKSVWLGQTHRDVHGPKQGEGAKLHLCLQGSGLREAVPNSAQLLPTKMSIY